MTTSCVSKSPTSSSTPDDLVRDHIGFSRSVARRYAHRGIELDDLQQVAAVALVLAAGRFDPQLGHSFAAYAGATIHGELKRHLRDHGWAVRPPRGLYDTYTDVVLATRALEQSMADVPTARDVADQLGIDVQLVHEARKVGSCYTAASLDSMLTEDAGLSIGDRLADPQPSQIDAVEVRLALAQSLRALTPRERLLIQLRFGHDLTQQQIGERLGISQMQVSRLLSAVSARLRASLAESFPDLSATWCAAS
ncbi:MAG: sigma-70 family RNA polymerase sigma factor [Actinomycetota bacterium]|nr:sigma-70 family RNA polymerase sigma factor [Actinomycetota bacterium]